jgi:hypothetical protein
LNYSLYEQPKIATNQRIKGHFDLQKLEIIRRQIQMTSQHTPAIEKIITMKNVRVWFSMVSYLKDLITIIRKRREKNHRLAC